MSTKMSRALVPLLAAPVALVCLATTAAAINVGPYSLEDDEFSTNAGCDHPNDDAYFEAFITTGEEDGPNEFDIKSMLVKMADANEPDDSYREPNVHAVELKYAFGIFDSNGFSPSSWTFKAGSKLKNGVFSTTKKAADVEAVKFDASFRLSDPTRMRYVSCVITLDGAQPVDS